tara:strand:+ start:80 stop:325 length:246 start_codon:yes stop_codon:yes gene_type:complete
MKLQSIGASYLFLLAHKMGRAKREVGELEIIMQESGVPSLGYPIAVPTLTPPGDNSMFGKGYKKNWLKFKRSWIPRLSSEV